MIEPRDAAPDEPPGPEEALGEIWALLDSLPAARTAPGMIVTTLEMAAVDARPAPPHAEAGGRGFRQAWRTWLAPAAIVVGATVLGVAAGRATAPDPEASLLADLPLVQQVDLLRELGSIAFLEEVARRGYPPPRRPPPTRSPADVRADTSEFDAAIAALRSAAIGSAGRDELAARRREVRGLSEPARRQLDRGLETFARLPAADRRDFFALARALADPAREDLLEAARTWHRWVRLRDPADRRDVIDLDTSDRLECLDRWTRLDGRGDARENVRQRLDRERDQRRRPPPEPRGTPGFRPGQPPDFRPEPPDRRPPPEFRPGPP